MPILKFNVAELPRTMTREQWLEAHRWLRVVSRKVEDELQNRIEQMIIFGRVLPPNTTLQ